jgi:hypothetical protein
MSRHGSRSPVRETFSEDWRRDAGARIEPGPAAGHDPLEPRRRSKQETAMAAVIVMVLTAVVVLVLIFVL